VGGWEKFQKQKKRNKVGPGRKSKKKLRLGEKKLRRA
jgi:hypothetical protein